jgi:PAS domain S-box-containing protein
MKHRKETKAELIALRSRAESRLLSPGAPPAAAAGALAQLHELQVHQLELEMQNQELQRIREEVEAGLSRYTALYDFAPVGYFTLDRDGALLGLNLSGARLLGQPRSELMGRNLAEFMPIPSRHMLARFLARVFSQETPEILEMELGTGQPPLRFVHLEAVVDEPGATCRAAVVDITARREAEQRSGDLLRQNRWLTGRMFSVQEAERRDLARELHDELGQWLTAIQAEAEAILGSGAAADDPRLSRSARAISDCAGEVHHLLRQMLHRLRPSLLDSLGLAASLQELAANWRTHYPQIACELEVVDDLRGLPELLGITVYRVVQEALTNVAKHARARRVAVRLLLVRDAAAKPQSLEATVEDDGRGFDTKPPKFGLGLTGMRERVLAAGGQFSLHGEPRRGVRIAIQLPLATPPQPVPGP